MTRSIAYLTGNDGVPPIMTFRTLVMWPGRSWTVALFFIYYPIKRNCPGADLAIPFRGLAKYFNLLYVLVDSNLTIYSFYIEYRLFIRLKI
ncbi:hypothetical protein BpHYR1_011973 [Brachionus plicatilis]|uniref:Uncharacterized protein n=1 Tax=Brachionus plicatilis TaxID=10195 RepID=A0A3M7S070_BRAPC|nr:hypothetical protein BpHYR1_011973 [Brachionus plicatilis]